MTSDTSSIKPRSREKVYTRPRSILVIRVAPCWCINGIISGTEYSVNVVLEGFVSSNKSRRNLRMAEIAASSCAVVRQYIAHWSVDAAILDAINKKGADSMNCERR